MAKKSFIMLRPNIVFFSVTEEQKSVTFFIFKYRTVGDMQKYEDAMRMNCRCHIMLGFCLKMEKIRGGQKMKMGRMNNNNMF